MARRAGLSHSAVSRILTGNRNPRLVNAKKLADVLKMNIEDFLASIPIDNPFEDQ